MQKNTEFMRVACIKYTRMRFQATKLGQSDKACHPDAWQFIDLAELSRVRFDAQSGQMKGITALAINPVVRFKGIPTRMKSVNL